MKTSTRFFCHISFSSSQNEKRCRQNVVEKIRTYILYVVIFFNRALCDIMWKNTVEPGRPLMTLWLAHAHCVLDTSGYGHIIRICNAHCFSTVTIVASMLRCVIRYTYIGGLVGAVMHYHNA
jgi:hypothetical protein